MAYTLADLTYRVARKLGIVTEGIATGGSTTTIVDTSRTEADDYWNGGTAWILYDAGGAGAAPQGEVKVITDFANSTGTVTAGTFSAAPAAGDRYAVAEKRVPLRIIEQQINDALIELGRIPVEYTGLTTAVTQTEYTLPTGSYDVRQVFIQTQLNDSDNNLWTEIINWRVASGLLIIPQPTAGYKLKVVYAGYHSNMTNATDTLSEYVPLVRIVHTAALKCMEWLALRTKWSDWDKQIQYFKQQQIEINSANPVQNLPRKPSFVVTLSDNRQGDPSTYDSVRLS